MCTVLLPPGANLIAVNKYIISIDFEPPAVYILQSCVICGGQVVTAYT